MDKSEALIAANLYAQVVTKAFKVKGIYLFGSFAKGNFHTDSDIDIAIVFSDFSNILDIQLELMRLRRSIDSRIEPHPFREADFKPSNPLVFEILNHGKTLQIGSA
jgi:predicted nucleotidyltransferase